MSEQGHIKTFRSNGKLLLTGEYVVLDGAMALAIPTKYGQSLTIEHNNTNNIVWKSFNDLGEIWFDCVFSFEDLASLNHQNETEHEIKDRLLQILIATQELNPQFLNSGQGYNVTTHQDFNRLWGLGTSSTLINNIANWAGVNAYKLLEKTFGGSGYDIACAQNNTPVTYRLNKENNPVVKVADFNPSYTSHLYFVYLNQKQNSRDGIQAYKALGRVKQSTLNDLSNLTTSVIGSKSLLEFEALINTHESLISNLINQQTIKSKLFKDFNGSIKSLGAWGGDFVLATSTADPTDYFKTKGYNTVIPYSRMVLK